MGDEPDDDVESDEHHLGDVHRGGFLRPPRRAPAHDPSFVSVPRRRGRRRRRRGPPPPLPSPSSSFPSSASLLVTCVNMRSSAFTSLYASLTRSARRLTDPPSVAPTDLRRPLCLYASTTRRQCWQSNAACEGG